MSVYRVGGNKSSQNVFPSVRPTLDLDFANSKTLDPRITFTRASGGSYVGADGLIKYAGVNEARFDHDPSTGESLGLLIEESRSNLFTSSVPQEGVWASTNNTLISNSEIAPDGTQRATLIDSDDTASVSHYIILNSPLTTATTYTQTFFVKAGTTRFVQIAPSTGFELTFANFELRDDGIIGTYNVYGASIQRFPNGWYRIGVTQTSTSTVGGGRMILVLGTALTDARLPQPHTSRLSCYVWGAQLEVGAFPTSYIPTEGSTRTRAADSASITGKNFSEWYRQDEGTIYVSQKLKSIATVDRNSLVYLINGGSGSGNDIFYNVKKGDTNIFVFGDNGTNYSRWQENGDSTDTKAIWAYDVSGDDFKPYWNGIEGINEPNSSSPSATSHTQLEIGATSNDKYNGHISKLTYYPRRLTNAQLQALTK